MRRNFSRSLSAKILLLTVACLLIGEVLIYVPSIARFRLTYLQERIAAAHLASLTLTPSLAATRRGADGHGAGPGRCPGADHSRGRGADGDAGRAGARAGGVRPGRRPLDDLSSDALDYLLHRGERLTRVVGPSPQEMGTLVDITLAEAPLWVALVDYSIRILTLSLVLSLLVAAMLFFGLQRMIVRPLRRITGELAAFRGRPEDGTADREPEPRADEIGVVEGELATMRAGCAVRWPSRTGWRRWGRR